jgi:two-component system, NtrC family, sensor kinase
MLPRRLRNRFALWGIVLTWLVGGVIAVVGYQQLTTAVRREAEARVDEAARVARRLLDAQFIYLNPRAPLPADARLLAPDEINRHKALSPLLQKARKEQRAEGFALLEEGLCMVSVRRMPAEDRYATAIWPLRGANWLPDHIREVVFGANGTALPSSTITIFEKDVRVATNVTLRDGRRAIGTHASPEVARRVIGEGRTWNDRAFVVNRWVIASYQPILSLDEQVVGMVYAGLDEAPYVAQRERNIQLFVSFILALTLLVSGASWYVGKRLTRPITQLTDAAAALGRGEREHIAAGTTDPEEVRVLAETFNRMADEIHAETTALEESNRKVKKALDDYMEVLGFVAHELKSPVAGALTQLETIDGGYAGDVPETFRGPLAALRRSLDYAHEIALSFNQLSGAEGEAFAARKRLIADFCHEVVSPAMGDFAAQASQRSITIALDAVPISLQADPDLLRVVMDNLIGNAVKYGEDGMEVRVTVRKLANGLRAEVYNRGVGVPAARFPELFGKFHRILDPKLRSRKGTGVGLYLVRKIIDLHGGQVGVEGEYGQWIRFWFEIPAGD